VEGGEAGGRRVREEGAGAAAGRRETRQAGGWIRGGGGGGRDGWGPQAVRMGKDPDPPRMRLSGGIAAKCSTCCSTGWSRNSAREICILQMQIAMGHLLETV
jgi:hypothetical protein